tara:strand:+ start:5109 stop:5216 length:108 start_codon:yes stop_codon:yes gene_type:complete
MYVKVSVAKKVINISVNVKPQKAIAATKKQLKIKI